MSEQLLNEYGLRSEVQNYLSLAKAIISAQEVADEAHQRLERLRADFKESGVALGNQAKLVGHAIAVHVEDLPGRIAYIPMPPTGYTDYQVTLQILKLEKTGPFVERQEP